MSIQTWRKVFCVNDVKLWRGLLKHNLKKHDVSILKGNLYGFDTIYKSYVVKKKILFPRGFNGIRIHDKLILTSSMLEAFNFWLKNGDATKMNREIDKHIILSNVKKFTKSLW